tara:strand:+ start:2164 stop:3993 length:1830 start_codon:yes stop_codon:yes gene_type:complete
MSFFEELKRRKVFRVAASYAVVAFVIMQLVEIVFPIFDFPQWTSQFVIIIVLLGFPIAIVLSWIFDKTPEGFIKTDLQQKEEVGGIVDNRPFYQQKRNVFLLLGVFAGLMIGLFGGRNITNVSSNSQNAFTKMAILPFTNIKQDKENDFLGFALSDEIINRLGYLKSIVVRPSGSVRKYQGTEADLNQVGNDLDVDLVLTGSYLRDGDQLRLSTELIDLNKNERLWNKTVQVDYSDIFEIQETVSRDIVEGLKYNLEPEEEEKLKTSDVDPLAYELYLKAKDMKSNNVPMMETKVELFLESINIDSSYSESWAELATACVNVAQATKKGQYYINLSKYAVRKAISLNSESLSSILAGTQLYSETGDVEKSTELSIKAMRLSGGKTGHAELGYNLRYAGLMNESMDLYQISSKLDESGTGRANFLIQSGKSNIYLGEIDKAISITRQGVGLAKNNNITAPVWLIYEGIPYLYSKMPEKAFPYFDFVSDIDPSNTWSIIGQTYKALVSGNTNKGGDLLSSLESRNIHDSEMIYRYTHFYVMLNDHDNALRALEKSVDNGFFCFPYIKSDPLTKPLHDNPRFKQILEKAKIRHELYEKRFGDEIRSLLGSIS